MSESTTTKPKLAKSEEKRFRRSVEEFLSEATSITNPSERMSELTEILSYFDENVNDFSDLKVKVEEAIQSAQKEIDVAIKEHISMKTTLGVDNVNTIAEGIEKIVTDTELLEKQSKDWKKIAGVLQGKLQSALQELEVRPTDSVVESLKEKMAGMKTFFEKKIEFMQNKIMKYQESITKNATLTEVTLSKLTGLQKKLREAESARVTLLKEATTLKEKNRKLTALVEEASTELDKIHEAQGRVIREAPVAAPNEMFEGYRESTQVREYYEDLVARHGKEITPYREHILGYKTLFEASKAYTGILAELDALPIMSEAMDVADRKAFTESTTGRKIVTKGGLKKPLGWE